jgi:WD40 repeat protein
VAFSPSGQALASAGHDGRLVLWTPASPGGAPRTFLASGPPLRSLAFTPDGKLLVSGAEDGTVDAWDVASGQRLRTWSLDRSPVNALTLDARGRGIVFAAHENRRVALLDLATGDAR